jgi:hypothetical protein
MTCQQCSTNRQHAFKSEVAIHPPESETSHESSILVFPTLSVCLHCGAAEFIIPKEELDQLASSHARSAP